MDKQIKSMFNKCIIIRLLLILVMILSFNSIFLNPVQATEIQIPVTEAYKRWSNLPEEERKKYIEPPMQSINYDKDTQIYQQSRLAMFDNLKTSYQPQYRLTGLTVKHQRQTNSCWAFAATTMLESNYAKLKNETAPLLSPRHMVYASSKTFLNGVINPYGYNSEITDGGSSGMVMGYCTNGMGAVLETSMPFQNNENQIDISEIQGKEVAQQVNSYVMFPNIYKTYTSSGITYHNGYDQGYASSRVEYTESEVESVRNIVKEHIINFGAVTTSTYIGDENEYFNKAKVQSGETSYYAYNCDNSDEFIDHAVTIIGWDDNFSVNNFNEEHKPKHDGAWIVQNSYGENWFNGGCYYISYDDIFIESDMSGVIDSSKPDYDKIYQHDPLGVSMSISMGSYSTLYGANVFTRDTASNAKEKLTKVSFYIAQTSNIEIYANTASDSLSNLTLIKNMGTLKAGYYTCKLDTPLEITGSKFAVAIKYSADKVQIPLEYNPKSNGNTTSHPWDTATASRGESYISANGTSVWKDVIDLGEKDSNLCIKAFTNYEITGITVNPTTKEMEVGDTYTLETTIEPTGVTSRSIVWTSSNTDVATVDDSGKITAKAVGNTTIMAATQDGSKTATCNVTVKANPVSVTGVTLNETTKQMDVGDAFTLTATVVPENANNKMVSWTSSNTDVATVDAAGKVTGVAVGNATITVTTQDGLKTATCNVIVKEKVYRVTGVALNEITKQMDVGDTYTLIATVAPTNATNKTVSWSSSNSNIVTVDQTGNIKGVAEGNATITVTTQDGLKTATCAVTVKEKIISVTGIEINVNEHTMKIGANLKITERVLPENATNKTVAWTSSNTNVATVDQTGKVTGVAEGNAIITVTTQDGSKTATCEVTVQKEDVPNVPVTGVTLNPTTEEMEIGDTKTLIATVAPENATNKNVTWNSSKPEIVTVDEKGNIKGVAEGNATITVTTEDGSKTATCVVTVKGKTEETISVTGVTLDADIKELEIGDTTTLIATVSPANATNKKVTWKSSNPSVATVDENGNIKAISEGETIITVTTQDGNKDVSCRIIVTKKADANYIKITKIILNTNGETLYIGKTYQLTATITPSNATNKDIKWESTDESIAKVDQSGKVTAVSKGITTIIAKSTADNISESCVITVLDENEDKNTGDHDIPNDPDVGEITINPTDPTTAPGILPQTGIGYFIMAMLIIITICGIKFAIGLYKTRDIK